MSAPTEFEPLLKDLVTAKRLSASKVQKLTELALASMQHDTQLVSILYRTHKTLPAVNKVNSLYAFDALARAARSQVNKKNITGDLNSPVGNCATFLLKVEGVLDGLMQDLVGTHTPEVLEKAKKVLDIWTKSATFPPPVLARLSDITKEKKGAYRSLADLSAKYFRCAIQWPSTTSNCTQ
ncbi:hypothetical protein BKA62DRAFT_352375 [Auriculariales sp. MPI-PUGE-AT-0066]|nr:hypothetical protein BKA62DRAFT_352375 [Auriculariales sp. MPI-PUGE-AT-0066]